MALYLTKKPQDVNGYNPEMFLARQKFLENYQCAICKWIVKDCVEVSCIDDDIHNDDIHSLNYNPIWCSKCLESYLNKNKDICPITGRKHDGNRSIKAIPTRYIRRQVSRAQVKCLNGHEFEDDHSHGAGSSEDSKDNDYEIDGLQSQVEGTNKNSDLQLMDGCQWQGLLCNYDKHVRDECGFVAVECPLNTHFNCCGNDTQILRHRLTLMMKNDVNYLSKHFQICFDSYLELKEKYQLIEKELKSLQALALNDDREWRTEQKNNNMNLNNCINNTKQIESSQSQLQSTRKVNVEKSQKWQQNKTKSEKLAKDKLRYSEIAKNVACLHLYKYRDGYLQVIVHGGNDLPNDSDGVKQQIDPFVKTRVPHNKEKRTKYIENSTNPVWNEKLTFKIRDALKDSIEFEVMDKDKFTKNDAIGVFSLPVLYVCQSNGSMINQKFPLYNSKYTKKFKSCGTIQVSLFYAEQF